MKNIVAFTFLFFCCSQVKTEVVFEGHLSGLTTQVSGDGYTGFRKFGTSFGLGALYALKKGGKKTNHFLSFQLNYTQKGARDRKNEKQGDFNEFSLRANYLELPLSYLFPLWGVYFEAGLAPAYNLKFEQKTNGITAPPLQDQRQVEWGLQLGINFEVTEKMIFAVQAMHSLTPIQKSSVPTSYWFRQAGMHSILAVKLQYYFRSPNFAWTKKNTDSTKESK